MLELADSYEGREQARVKHFLLDKYLDRLVHKTASVFPQIAYVDGFSGPWQNRHENFEDMSFGIALAALTKAKATWTAKGHRVRMSAYLVERDPDAYSHLQRVKTQFPEVEIKTYLADFPSVASKILTDIPRTAFAFMFIDPKGWTINMSQIACLLRRQNSEVVFNFMFDFINRFAGIEAPKIKKGLDELIGAGPWREHLASNPPPGLSVPDFRKAILVKAFSATLADIGGYQYVAETTILRPNINRPLYCLFYGTRKPQGIEVFRDCQIKTMREQTSIRAEAKFKRAEVETGQVELFGPRTELAVNDDEHRLDEERTMARRSLLEFTPEGSTGESYGHLWPQVLARHLVRKIELGEIVADLRKSGELEIDNWRPGTRRPDDACLLKRPGSLSAKET